MFKSNMKKFKLLTAIALLVAVIANLAGCYVPTDETLIYTIYPIRKIIVENASEVFSFDVEDFVESHYDSIYRLYIDHDTFMTETQTVMGCLDSIMKEIYAHCQENKEHISSMLDVYIYVKIDDSNGDGVNFLYSDLMYLRLTPWYEKTSSEYIYTVHIYETIGLEGMADMLPDLSSLSLSDYTSMEELGIEADFFSTYTGDLYGIPINSDDDFNYLPKEVNGTLSIKIYNNVDLSLLSDLSGETIKIHCWDEDNYEKLDFTKIKAVKGFKNIYIYSDTLTDQERIKLNWGFSSLYTLKYYSGHKSS